MWTCCRTYAAEIFASELCLLYFALFPSRSPGSWKCTSTLFSGHLWRRLDSVAYKPDSFYDRSSKFIRSKCRHIRTIFFFLLNREKKKEVRERNRNRERVMRKTWFTQIFEDPHQFLPFSSSFLSLSLPLLKSWWQTMVKIEMWMNRWQPQIQVWGHNLIDETNRDRKPSSFPSSFFLPLPLLLSYRLESKERMKNW